MLSNPSVPIASDLSAPEPRTLVSSVAPVPGPRPEPPSSRPRPNALKHGIMAREVLVQTGPAREDEAELEALGHALRAQFAPRGALQELLVDQIVAIAWRWRRLLRFETAAIVSGSLATLQRLRPLDSSSGPGAAYAVSPLGDDLTAALPELDADLAALDSSDPLAARPQLWHRAFQLAEAQFGAQIERLLAIDEEDWRDSKGFTARQVKSVLSDACKRSGLDRSGFWSAVRSAAQRERDQTITKIASREQRSSAIMAATCLPNDNDLQKVRRYEAHLSRQFYRALHELDRLQYVQRVQDPPPALEAERSGE